MKGDRFFRAILGISLGATVVIQTCRWGVAHWSLRTNTARSRESSATLLLPNVLVDVGLVGAGAWALAPARMAWSKLPLPTWLRWLGSAFSIVGLPLLAWTHLALGRNYSGGAILRKGHRLVTQGPYRWVRHPLYSSIFLLLGYFLLSANWFVGLFGLGPWAATIAWRLGREEGLLIERFGDEYREYVRRTGRFLPRIGGAGTATSQDHRQEAG